MLAERGYRLTKFGEAHLPKWVEVVEQVSLATAALVNYVWNIKQVGLLYDR